MHEQYIYDGDIRDILTIVRVFEINSQVQYEFPISISAKLKDLRKQIQQAARIKSFVFLWNNMQFFDEDQSFQLITKCQQITIRSFEIPHKQLMIQDIVPSNIMNILDECRNKFQKEYIDKIKQIVKCPISHQLPSNPVILEDGYTYDRKSIEEWFRKGKSSSPMTNNSITNKSLTDNRALAGIIPLLNNIPQFLKTYVKEIDRFYQDQLEKQKNKHSQQIKKLTEENNRKQLYILSMKKQLKNMMKMNQNDLQKGEQNIEVQQPINDHKPESTQLRSVLTYGEVNTISEKQEDVNEFVTSIYNQETTKEKSILFLDYYNYLEQKFKFKQQIQSRLKFTFQKEQPFKILVQLNHDQEQLQIDKFISQDCKNITKLSLNRSSVTNQQWKKLVQNADKFQCLTSLCLNGNRIENLTLKQIQAFKNLKYIDLRNNPLNKDSLLQLELGSSIISPITFHYNQYIFDEMEKNQLLFYEL